MTAPRKPQDHQPKTEKPSVVPVDGGKEVTCRGVTVMVPDEALDDFELVEELGRVQFGDQTDRGRLPLILRRLVGDDGYRTVMDGLRGDNGRVPVQAGFDYVLELFGALNPNS
jgi:hypothetical protein